MKSQLTLCDLTLDTIITQLRQVLEAPFFEYNGNKFSAGKVLPHCMKDAISIIHGRKRPMVLLRFDGSTSIPFYEGDIIIADGTGKIVVKGEKEMSFSRTTCTAKEAREIEATARLNKQISDSYWRSAEIDM